MFPDFDMRMPLSCIGLTKSSTKSNAPSLVNHFQYRSLNPLLHSTTTCELKKQLLYKVTSLKQHTELGGVVNFASIITSILIYLHKKLDKRMEICYN